MARTRRRVVLVDDSPPVRTLLRRLLGRSPDFQVVAEAGDGVEAVELIRAVQPDVVLIDESMPRLSGLDAIPLLREAAPGAKVVVLSGRSDHVRQAMEAGADGFLEKGPLSTRLAAELDALLEATET